jgi:WD40 repeat protein
MCREGQEAVLDMPSATTALCCHPTNDSLLLTSSDDKCLRVWDVRSKRPALVSQKFDYISVGWNCDGSRCAPCATKRTEVRFH